MLLSLMLGILLVRLLLMMGRLLSFDAPGTEEAGNADTAAPSADGDACAAFARNAETGENKPF